MRRTTVQDMTDDQYVVSPWSPERESGADTGTLFKKGTSFNAVVHATDQLRSHHSFIEISVRTALYQPLTANTGSSAGKSPGHPSSRSVHHHQPGHPQQLALNRAAMPHATGPAPGRLGREFLPSQNQHRAQNTQKTVETPRKQPMPSAKQTKAKARQNLQRPCHDRTPDGGRHPKRRWPERFLNLKEEETFTTHEDMGFPSEWRECRRNATRLESSKAKTPRRKPEKRCAGLCADAWGVGTPEGLRSPDLHLERVAWAGR